MDDRQWHEMVETYFDMLHPQYSSYSPAQRWEAADDENFIIENTELVDRLFHQVDNMPGRREMNGREMMNHVMWSAKIAKLFQVLYSKDGPSYEDDDALHDDHSFIIENTEELYRELDAFKSKMAGTGYIESHSDEEVLRDVMKTVKIRNYFDLLHPNFRHYEPGKRFDSIEDKDFIREHLDEVDYIFKKEFSNSDSPRYMDGATAHERIVAAMKELKQRELGKENIEPKDALESALRSGVTAEEVAKVPLEETKEKEGERVDE